MRMKILPILIAFAFLGCLAESPQLEIPATPQSPITPTQSEIPAITPTPSPISKITSVQEFQFGVKYPARVIYVYDGDTIKVNLSGQILIIRLLGVDTPEKYPEKNKPYEYDAITNLTYLAEWGLKAKDFAYEMLYNKTVYIEFDEVASLKGYYGRYLAYVYVNGTDFNALLVKNGLASVYIEGEFRKKNYYIYLEKEARTNKIGLWRIAK